MTHEEFRAHLYRDPFQPFRVILKDGRSYEVLHPNLGLAAEACLIIGIPAPDDPNPIYGDRSEWIRWQEVDRVEPFPRTVAPSS
jgi:hypothetical protein